MTRHPDTDWQARAWALRACLAVDVLFMLACCTGCGGGSDQPAPPRVLTVALLGDSTMEQQGNRLQPLMDAHYGKGRVLVTNYGVSGSVSAQAVPHAADVVVANYGINDARFSVPLAQYAANMRATGATLIETANPTNNSAMVGDNGPAYVATARGLGLPVADTDAYVLSIPNWQSYMPDGVHPNDALKDLIAANVLAPAIERQLDAAGAAL